MIDWLITQYSWIKALHIVAVIAWMAGLLYLPRLFVYHVEAGAGSPQADTFVIMERRLLRAIMNPAMIAVWVFGLIMLIVDWDRIMRGGGWMHAKLSLVVLMTAFHMVLARWRRRLAAGEINHGSVFFRVANEAPTVLMIAIVILAVVEPF